MVDVNTPNDRRVIVDLVASLIGSVSQGHLTFPTHCTSLRHITDQHDVGALSIDWRAVTSVQQRAEVTGLSVLYGERVHLPKLLVAVPELAARPSRASLYQLSLFATSLMPACVGSNAHGTAFTRVFAANQSLGRATRSTEISAHRQ